MKSIAPTIRGLASSLLLNVGFSQAAEKFDPVADRQIKLSNVGGAVGAIATYPSQFTARRR